MHEPKSEVSYVLAFAATAVFARSLAMNHCCGIAVMF
jgi:hypothetical protein